MSELQVGKKSSGRTRDITVCGVQILEIRNRETGEYGVGDRKYRLLSRLKAQNQTHEAIYNNATATWLVNARIPGRRQAETPAEG
jgi:hypothetical protein